MESFRLFIFIFGCLNRPKRFISYPLHVHTYHLLVWLNYGCFSSSNLLVSSMETPSSRSFTDNLLVLPKPKLKGSNKIRLHEKPNGPFNTCLDYLRSYLFLGKFWPKTGLFNSLFRQELIRKIIRPELFGPSQSWAQIINDLPEFLKFGLLTLCHARLKNWKTSGSFHLM